MTDSFLQNPHLDGKTFHLSGNSTGFLLFHGFGATTVEVRALGEFLHVQGYTIYGPLLPGHGTSPDDMNRRHWQDWTEAAENAYTEIQKTCETVWVGGESMGGLLSLYLASRHPEIIGLLIYAPALKVKGIWRSAFMRWFVKTKTKSYTKTNTLSKPTDDAMPWQGYLVTPIPAAFQLYRLQKQINLRLKNITQPTAIFQGRLDRTISLESSPSVYDRIASKVKQLRWYDNSSHCILLDKEFNQVANDSLDFIHSIQDA